jgi:chemotaxis protein methyltransferase CheR
MSDVLNRAVKDVPPLGYGDYLRFGKLLMDRCGLFFSDHRRAELEQGIRQAFAASTCADLDEYHRLLQDSQAGAVEMDRLINAVTISETHFFRDTAQFDALYNHVLPQIIERRRPLRTLRIWSAGCASGEEPYSLAMLLRELLPDIEEWSVTILGTDINTGALERARRATFGEWAFREERAKQWRPRYFQRNGNRYELAHEVRRMVTFGKLNLAENSYPSYQTNTTLMDLVLCRNVTIYFSEYVTLEVVGRLYNALVDGGWLVVGHSEPSLTIYKQFQVRNFPSTILYQRVSQPMTMPQEWNWPTVPAEKYGLPAAPIAAPPLPAPVPPKPAPLSAQLIPPAPPTPEVNPLEHAHELLEFGRAEEARDMLLKLAQAQPNHAPTCTLLGQAFANMGHWQAAEKWCRQAVNLDKLALDAYYTLALVLQHQGALDQAIDAMKKVVYLDRNYVLGHFGLANLYRDSHQLPQAQKSLDNARRLLSEKTDDDLIPRSGGITVGRLRDAIIRQQQAWSVT